MDADLLQAYLLSQFFHTGGHFYQATNPDNPMRDVSMRLDPKALVENWGEDAEGKLPDRWKPPKKGEPYNALRMSHQD